MACTRKPYLRMDKKIGLTQFPFLNESLESMVVKNASKASHLLSQHVRYYINLNHGSEDVDSEDDPENEDIGDVKDQGYSKESEAYYSEWLDAWKVLVKSNRSIQDIEKFQSVFNAMDPAEPLSSAKSILDLLTLISDKPELIDRELLLKVTEESGLDDPQTASNPSPGNDPKDIKHVLDQIDDLGFNTLAFFKLYQWNYEELVISPGADYLIRHQYYPICYQLVINADNLPPESQKSYNTYPSENKIGTDRYNHIVVPETALYHMRMLSINLLPALLNDLAYNSRFMFSMKSEIKKLARPARECMIDLVRHVINKHSVSVSTSASKSPEILYIGTEMFEHGKLGNDVIGVTHSYLNVFERYRAGILPIDFKQRFDEAVKYFNDTKLDVDQISKYLELTVHIDQDLIGTTKESRDYHLYNLLEKCFYIFMLFGYNINGSQLELLEKVISTYFKNGVARRGSQFGIRQLTEGNTYKGEYYAYYPIENEGFYTEAFLDLASEYLTRSKVCSLILSKHDYADGIMSYNTLLPAFVNGEFRYIGLMITENIPQIGTNVRASDVLTAFTQLIALELVMNVNMNPEHLNMFDSILDALVKLN